MTGIRSWTNKVRSGAKPLPSWPSPDSQSRCLWLNDLRLLRKRAFRAMGFAARIRLQEWLGGRPSLRRPSIRDYNVQDTYAGKIAEKSIEVDGGHKNQDCNNCLESDWYSLAVRPFAETKLIPYSPAHKRKLLQTLSSR